MIFMMRQTATEPGLVEIYAGRPTINETIHSLFLYIDSQSCVYLIHSHVTLEARAIGHCSLYLSI